MDKRKEKFITLHTVSDLTKKPSYFPETFAKTFLIRKNEYSQFIKELQEVINKFEITQY